MPDKESIEDLDPSTDPEGEVKPDQGELESEPETDSPSEVEGLTQALSEANARADAHWEKFARAQAEMENLRKRRERDVENAHKYGLEKFAAELLPVKDSLELGLNAAEGEKPDAEKLREGTELTLRMLSQAMEKFNIQAIDPRDAPFDPELHQAMTTREEAGLKPNTVVSVIQKGYKLNDRLLRPAMVIVSKPPANNAGE